MIGRLPERNDDPGRTDGDGARGRGGYSGGGVTGAEELSRHGDGWCPENGRSGSLGMRRKGRTESLLDRYGSQKGGVVNYVDINL